MDGKKKALMDELRELRELIASKNILTWSERTAAHSIINRAINHIYGEASE